MEYNWVLPDQDSEEVHALIQTTGISSLIARILIGRGIYSKEKLQDFFNPSLQKMYAPELLHDMDRAIERISRAIQNQEIISIYGDYDVDGVTGTSLLYTCLQLLGAKVNYYLPHRVIEGYGLNCGAIDQLADDSTKLIITVDCGIRGFDAVAHANERGLDVIITDHHEIDSKLPDAYAIINPKDKRGHYPFNKISGVGVAFKLAWALCHLFSPGLGNKVRPEYRKFLLNAMAFVAIGTVADIVPLIDENRIITRYGLIALQRSQNFGIKALKKVARLEKNFITAHDIGFRLGPLINAMGRLEHSNASVELFTTPDENRAFDLAKQLETENSKRRRLQHENFTEALQQIEQKNYQDDMVLVLDQEGWHSGVIGIVASRLQEIYYRPVCVISLDADSHTGKASARSVPGFNLFMALKRCQEYLINFGGHEMAAGFQIEKSRIPDLRRELNQIGQEILPEKLAPNLNIDACINLSEITWDLFRQIDRMAPFGSGNPQPLFCSQEVEIVQNPRPSRRGSKGEHLSFYVSQDKHNFKAIAFRMGELQDQLIKKGKCRIAFHIIRNTWGNRDDLELEIRDIRL